MAGFRASSAGLVDMRVVPYPAVTVFIDFGDGLLVDEASGQGLRGSVAAGLAPGAVLRGRGRDARRGPENGYTERHIQPEDAG